MTCLRAANRFNWVDAATRILLTVLSVYVLSGCPGEGQVDAGATNANGMDGGVVDSGKVSADAGFDPSTDGGTALDGGRVTDAGTPATISFTHDIVPIFELRCDECHVIGLPLTAENLAQRTTGFACVEDEEGASTFPFRVEPFAPERSLLWIKIADTDFSLECGREMPANGTPLLTSHPAEAQLIYDWIAQGAPYDD